MAKRRKSLLITGCSSGIGHYCALTLARRNDWHVIATVRQAGDRAALENAGITTVTMEMSDPEGSINQGLATTLVATEGQLDAIFLNAGYGQFGALEDIDHGCLSKQLAINVIGPMHIVRSLLPIMRSQGHGRIVFNSSVLGICAMPLRGAYSASKFALEGLADTLRIELADSNIHVSSIEPGPIKSRFNDNALRIFQRDIDYDDNSYWAPAYQRLEARLKGGFPAHDTPWRRFTLGPGAVLTALEHALNATRPRSHYPVTLPSHMLFFLRRLLSRQQLHRLLVRAGKRETGESR